MAGVVADGGEARLLGRRVGDRRRVVDRRRGEGEDLAGPRVEHDDRAAVVAEPLDRGPLEREREREREGLRVVRIGLELLAGGCRIGSGSLRPRQLARRTSARGRPTRTGGWRSRRPVRRPIRVDAVEPALRVLLVRGEDRCRPGRRSRRGRRSRAAAIDRGIVRRARQVLASGSPASSRLRRRGRRTRASARAPTWAMLRATGRRAIRRPPPGQPRQPTGLASAAAAARRPCPTGPGAGRRRSR